jgi:hypothetical protein
LKGNFSLENNNKSKVEMIDKGLEELSKELIKQTP